MLKVKKRFKNCRKCAKKLLKSVSEKPDTRNATLDTTLLERDKF